MSLKPLIAAAIALLTLPSNDAHAKPPQRHSLPRCVRLTLAGVPLKDAREGLILYDVRSGYYLVGSSQDIGNRGWDLVPDLGQMVRGSKEERAEVRRHTRPAALPRLRAGWGVNIGDTPRQVRRKLGPPQRRLHGHEGAIELQYLYDARLYQDDTYEALYSFRHGRLWEINYMSGPADQ